MRTSFAREAQRPLNPRAILNSVVVEIQASLEASRTAIQKHEAVFDGKLDQLGRDELRAYPDEVALDYVYQFGLCAEVAQDWLSAMKREAKALLDWRNSTGCWSEDADRILAKLERLASVFAYTNQCFHRWADQLADEYARRHPELAEVSLQPLDLGPTNAARLPRVL
jgi:hypothetical protein